MNNRLMLTGVLALLGVVGCGADSGGATAGPNTKPGDAGATVPDGGAAEAAVDCGASDSGDSPDADGMDENCDGADGVVGVDVYVDPSAGSDTNPGSPAAPLRSLKAAILLASSRAGRVLLAKGKLEIDGLDVAGSYEVHGGYSPTFAGPRKRESSVLAPTKPEGLVLSGATEVTLASLSIVGPNGDDTVPTAHALRTSVDHLRLVDVKVQAGDASPGASVGEAGAGGEPGVSATGSAGSSATCKGQVPPSYSKGASVGKPNAAGALPGNCAAKTPAASGAAGQAGTHGAHASSAPVLDGGLVRWAPGSAAVDNAGPGLGGAGGASCALLGPYGGGAGSGGCPGGPGAGATSGGGSVAVVVLAGKLTLSGSLLRTGFGGNGGSGAPGGEGGLGGRGFRADCSASVDCAKIPAECTPATDPYQLGCAGWGGAGGPGGKGGHGGAGAGGWTIGVVTVGAAAIDHDGGSSFELGAPGNGGDGASTRAPDGEKRKTWALP
jgi:hypothetical protein